MNERLRPLAKELRHRQTDAENNLWYFLRSRRLTGIKFRRQEPMGNYVVDFVCYDKKLIIELDGSQHSDKTINEHDRQRTSYFEKEGYTVLRFWDNEVLQNIEGVLDNILNHLN